MTLLHVWNGSNKLNLLSEEFPSSIVKLACSDNNIVFLDEENQLWHGKIANNDLTLRKTGVKCLDITPTENGFYYVKISGCVYKSDSELVNEEELVIQEGSSCRHGYATGNRKTFVTKVSYGGMGLMCITNLGELWVSGTHSQLGIDTNDLKRVSFFDGRVVTAASSGEDFNIIITHKRDDFSTEVNTKKDDVFMLNCPQCSNETIVSPISVPSENGPSTKKSSESLSLSTSSSKNKRSNSSSFSEDSARVSDISLALNEDYEGAKESQKGSNMLLINTEAARQFLTRQLSWVSYGGEELLAEVTGPTRMIKRNVSTVASLVYERVKTVGDKVATLSRHVSGGSDNNSESFEEFEELNNSNNSINSLRLDWTGSEISEDIAPEKTDRFRSKGSRLIKGEVWAWGNAQYGQLGTGDFIKRHKPVLVSLVSNDGVLDVQCGTNHCLVHTLDGRLFGWGSNKYSQIIKNSEKDYESSPLLIERVLYFAAGNKNTVMINRSGKLLWQSNETHTPKIEDLEIKDLTQNLNYSGIYCSGDVTCLLLKDYPSEATINSDLAHEQCFLEELLTVQNVIVKPLLRKSSLDDVIINLCAKHRDILHLTANLVSSLRQSVPSYKVLAENQDDLVIVYESYLETVCNVIAINGFLQITRIIEIPAKVIACFSDRLPTRKTSAESIISCAFSQPLSHTAVYRGMISRGCEGHKKLKNLLDCQELKRKEAEITKAFWESTGGRIPEYIRTPQRRIIRESRSSPLVLNNSSRFSTHWFILMSNLFLHITGTTHTAYNVDTLWIEPNNDSELQMVLVTPEETMILVTPNSVEKAEWYQCFQTCIKSVLKKSSVPDVRIASHTFNKHPLYKNAKYSGRWVRGKMEGLGKLVWSDGRIYTGHFHNNYCHGRGRMEVPNTSVYEGQWREGAQNGHGITKYENGDVYVGYYKDGCENGHGVRKTGRLTSSQASVYVGEWVLGQRHGYGVSNNVCTGEKYLGSWNGNLKSGSGLIVTHDGIYYEGSFVQDALTGRGVMVFEDGTHYEGELKEHGVFNGKGTLNFRSGEIFEGSLYGTWDEGVKISGTLQKPIHFNNEIASKPASFGQLSVTAENKWKSIFRQCWSSLGITGEGKNNETEKAWESIAIILSNRLGTKLHERLQMIPHYKSELDLNAYTQIVLYIQQAFDNTTHPLGRALAELVEAYTTTYGGVLVHPLLLPQAVAELRSITYRLYQVVRVLFPSLPSPSSYIVFDKNNNDVATMNELLHPIILPKLYSSLLILYSLHNRKENETYWKRLLKWNRQSDMTLMPFLGVDKQFWLHDDGTLISENIFSIAIETLQQLKTTFSPMEKLILIHSTFKEITKAVQNSIEGSFTWQMDNLFPVFHYVVVRSHIQELGSEIHFIEDFFEERLKNGEMDIMFTTLKACYFQILQEKVSIT